MLKWNIPVDVLDYSILVKKQIHACSDLLLNISLAGGQSLKWINHEREAGIASDLYTNKSPIKQHMLFLYE